MQKNKKISLQNLIQRNKRISLSLKEYSQGIDKKLYISTQIHHHKSILCCSWHPRKIQGFYSPRGSLSFLIKQQKHIKSVEIFCQETKFKENKKQPVAYEITSMDFNAIGTLISTTFYNGFLVIWTETGIPLIKTMFLDRAIIDSKWSEDSRNIAVGYLSGEIEILSVWYSQILFIILPHRSLLISLEWKDIKNLVTFSKEKILSTVNFSDKEIYNIRGHDSQINDIDYSVEKNLLASCSDDFTIKLWDLNRKLEFLFSFIGHEKEVVIITFKPFVYQKKKSTRKFCMASGSLDFSVRIWDIKLKTCLKFFKVDGPIFSMDWSCNYETLLIGTCGKVFELNLNGIKTEFRQIEGSHGIFSLVSHPMINKTMGFSNKKIFIV